MTAVKHLQEGNEQRLVSFQSGCSKTPNATVSEKTRGEAASKELLLPLMTLNLQPLLRSLDQDLYLLRQSNQCDSAISKLNPTQSRRVNHLYRQELRHDLNPARYKSKRLHYPFPHPSGFPHSRKAMSNSRQSALGNFLSQR